LQTEDSRWLLSGSIRPAQIRLRAARLSDEFSALSP
jgi:hypothetical protein